MPPRRRSPTTEPTVEITEEGTDPDTAEVARPVVAAPAGPAITDAPADGDERREWSSIDDAPDADAGGSVADDDSGSPGDDLESEEEVQVWVVVVDTEGTPWGGAVARSTPHALTIVTPAMHDIAGNRDYPQRWIQFAQRSIKRIHEVDELTAGAVALQRWTSPLSPWGTSPESLAAMVARIQVNPA